MHDPTTWEAIDGLPDHIFWSVHQYLKSRMLHTLRQRVRNQHFRNQGSEAHLDRMLRYTDPDDPNVLTIGFGRRFATYKRATLLFDDPEWLKQILSDPHRPALFIFAGRAHPADVPGQELIRRVAEIARMPELEDKLLLVEGYDLRFARRLVSGDRPVGRARCVKDARTVAVPLAYRASATARPAMLRASAPSMPRPPSLRRTHRRDNDGLRATRGDRISTGTLPPCAWR